MSELFSQLGVSLPALLAQGFNFLVVLLVLTFFVYRPLGKIVDERRKKIESGLEHARQADLRLSQISEKEQEVLHEAEKSALVLIKSAEGEANEKAKVIIAEGEKKGASLVKEAKTLATRRTAEEWVTLEREAREFVKVAISKTVELEPGYIDEKLIDQAVRTLRNTRA